MLHYFLIAIIYCNVLITNGFKSVHVSLVWKKSNAKSLTSSKVHCNALVNRAGGIYVHIPFCRRRCFYCDFPIKVVGESKTAQQSQSMDYSHLLITEIRKTAECLRDKPSINIDSIYFGGGTPSLMTTECLQAVIQELYQHYSIDSDVEITLEADPGTFNLPKLVEWSNIGINRLSVGVQSFNNTILQACGRAHTSEDVLRAIHDIHSSPIDNFSIDLMSSLPYLTLDGWLTTLQQAMTLEAPHLSIYDLQVEEKTSFGRWYTPGIFPLPTEEESVRLYTETVRLLTDPSSSHYYKHYEVSNYAKVTTTGKSHRSRHNQKYWHCLPTYAFGMGAASYLNSHRFTRPATMDTYREWIENIAHENMIDSSALISFQQDILGEDYDSIQSTKGVDVLEYVMLALRTADGLRVDETARLYSSEVSENIVKASEMYLADGSLEYNKAAQILRLTDPKGFLISNQVISSIFAAIS